MGDVVDLAGKPAHLENDSEFVRDLCRFAESLLDEKAIRKKYRLANDVWEALGSNDALIEAVEAEKIRRIRNGDTKREKSQSLITKAPAILDGIMSDPGASPRHRVDAIKTLDGFAANAPEGAPPSDRFVITINLNGDVEHYDKSITINADDVAPNVAAPVEAIKHKRKPPETRLNMDSEDGGTIREVE